jgi:hypothetical protein
VLVFSGVIDGFVLVDLLSSQASNTPMSVIRLAMSFVIAVIGFLGYRWLAHGERGSRLGVLTTIAGSEG